MNQLSSLAPYFRKHQKTFYIGFVFVVLSNLGKVFSPKLIGTLIDEILTYLKSGASSSEIVSIVLRFIAYYFIITLLSAIFTFLMRQTIIVASRKIEFEMKNNLYAHYQSMEITFFKKFFTGDLMSRMSEDIAKVREFVGPAVMYMLNMLTMLLVSIYFMWRISPELTFYVLSPLPFLSFGIYYLNNKIYSNNLEKQKLLGQLTSFAQETYNGIRIVKSFVKEKVLSNKFTDISHEYKTQSLRVVKLESTFQPLITSLISLSILIAVYKGGALWLDHRISSGELTEFIMYVNMLTWPVMSIGWIATMIQRASASMERLNSILEIPTEATADHVHREATPGNIIFDNVSFTYPETGIEALKEVSFEIPFGQKWLIVGKTGSGKSTIAELLMHFYDIEQGAIKINNQDIKGISKRSVRNLISYVPQEVFLFSDTVSQNIAFGSETVDNSLIESAAKKAQIHNEVVNTTFPEKYSTVVGERGVMLSGGQKQRISIARAMLKDAPIWIFDDCLSALDVTTEKKLIDAFDHQDQKHTLLLISHRIFNHLAFDKIIVLNEGAIEEIGTHEELIKSKKTYWEFYTKQELIEKQVS